MIAVYIPCKNTKEARHIAHELLKERLIACAGLWPIRSLYEWKGKLEDCPEVVILAKSQGRNFARIKRRVIELHSYEVPAIVKWHISANEEYKEWVNKQSVTRK
jgi:periplasmic divalent cation tolerance protein